MNRYSMQELVNGFGGMIQGEVMSFQELRDVMALAITNATVKHPDLPLSRIATNVFNTAIDLAGGYVDEWAEAHRVSENNLNSWTAILSMLTAMAYDLGIEQHKGEQRAQITVLVGGRI